MLRTVFNFDSRMNRARAWLFFAVLFWSEIALTGVERLAIWVGDRVGSHLAVRITDHIVVVVAVAYAAAAA